MTYTQTLQNIINDLSTALADSQKFDQGTDIAGQRLRSKVQAARNQLKDFRSSVQADRNSRKDSKKTS